MTRIEASYPRQTKAVQDYLEKLHACEKENNPDLDLAAGYTGEVMAEIYIPEEDIWSDDLRQVGFYIGKFIYLMDALDDVEKIKRAETTTRFCPSQISRTSRKPQKNPADDDGGSVACI